MSRLYCAPLHGCSDYLGTVRPGEALHRRRNHLKQGRSARSTLAHVPELPPKELPTSSRVFFVGIAGRILEASASPVPFGGSAWSHHSIGIYSCAVAS